jgi:hypothetical protein
MIDHMTLYNFLDQLDEFLNILSNDLHGSREETNTVLFLRVFGR